MLVTSTINTCNDYDVFEQGSILLRHFIQSRGVILAAILRGRVKTFKKLRLRFWKNRIKCRIKCWKSHKAWSFTFLHLVFHCPFFIQFIPNLNKEVFSFILFHFTIYSQLLRNEQAIKVANWVELWVVTICSAFVLW